MLNEGSINEENEERVMASINENDDLDPLPPNTVCIAN